MQSNLINKSCDKFPESYTAGPFKYAVSQ